MEFTLALDPPPSIHRESSSSSYKEPAIKRLSFLLFSSFSIFSFADFILSVANNVIQIFRKRKFSLYLILLDACLSAEICHRKVKTAQQGVGWGWEGGPRAVMTGTVGCHTDPPRGLLSGSVGRHFFLLINKGRLHKKKKKKTCSFGPTGRPPAPSP